MHFQDYVQENRKKHADPDVDQRAAYVVEALVFMLAWISLGGGDFPLHQHRLVVAVIDDVDILVVEADRIRILQQFLQLIAAIECILFQEITGDGMRN